MPRTWIWLQLVVGWLPMWGLYATIIVTAHPGVGVHSAAFIAFRAIGIAAALGLVVFRLTDRLPWPHPLSVRFVAIHVGGAVVYATSWLLLTLLIEFIMMRSQHAVPFGLPMRPSSLGFGVVGILLYVMVTGVTYATQATQRAAIAEANAVRSRLAALRSQLNPHFLFNALHTVVQLIPREPGRATKAAEQLAELLRTTLEEDRDVVTLGEEWSFVERYLAIERIRFGDRLVVTVDIAGVAGNADHSTTTSSALIPSFALQTLVENAVRHGAAPRVEPTTVAISARFEAGVLTLAVHDTGAGATAAQRGQSSGTGLVRLEDRLRVLTRGQARLELSAPGTAGFAATLIVPQESFE